MFAGDFFELYFMRFSFFFLFILSSVFLSCSSPEEKIVLPVPADTTLSQKISSINEKIKQENNNASLYFQRAQLHFEDKNLESSLNDVGRALKLDSSSADSYLLLADIHFIRKEGMKAKEALNKCLEIDPQKTEAYLKLSEIYFLVEQYGKSIEFINQALKIDKHNSKAYFMKGMNYKYNGDTANAISSMQTAVEQDNDFYDAYIQLGLMYGAKHDSVAIHYYDNAFRINVKSIEALYGKSLFLQEHGQPEKAIEGYQRILEIDKTKAVAYFNIGYVNLVYLEKLPEAKENFTKAIELNPNYFEAYCNRGIACEQMKDLKRAELDFRKALEIQPDYTPAAKGISRVVDRDYD